MDGAGDHILAGAAFSGNQHSSFHTNMAIPIQHSAADTGLFGEVNSLFH
jgi:hypothetical protein